MIAFPASGWLLAELKTLTDCSVYDHETWRCISPGSVQNVNDGLYVRASSAALLNGYEECGSTRIRDVARYLVGASPPDPSS